MFMTNKAQMDRPTQKPAAAIHYSVLLVEDGESESMTAEFEELGMNVVSASDATQAVNCLDALEFDVVLLDCPLAHDAIEICKAIRRTHDIPVLTLDPNDAEEDRIRGLEAGVDECIVEPVSFRELVARIKAHARRRRGLMRPGQVFTVGPLVLDERTRSATLRGEALSLTDYEFALLRELAAEPGRVMTRDQLLERTRGSGESFDRSIDVRISRLRQKLCEDPRAPKLLLTIRGVGYKLVPGD